ncbi:MAG: carbonic anhydrase [Planctomycetota bacterium]
MNAKMHIIGFGCSLLVAASLSFLLRAPAPVAHAEAHDGDPLKKLVEGNQRFVAGHAQRPNQDAARRAETAEKQHPFAAIVCCADSRVAPELVFDQGIGDLFVVRVAGNVLDDHLLGSLEYAVEHLHVGLIVVVGHERCGAVAATLAGGHAPGHIESLVAAIGPAVAGTAGEASEKLDAAVRANVAHVVEQLIATEPILSEHIAHHKLRVVGARYDLDTGAVELLPARAPAKSMSTRAPSPKPAAH